MIYTEEQTRQETIERLAAELLAAARTAPKARGTDHLSLAAVTEPEKSRLADRMRQIAQAEPNRAFFARDAANVDAAGAVVLLGTTIAPLGLNCALCGFSTCAAKKSEVPCAFNTHDLGLAVGSLVSRAADLRLDCRVMYSVGVAAQQLGLLPGCGMVIGIPLSVGPKSPFFDRAH